MRSPWCLIRPLLFRMDPETAHELTIKALSTGLAPSVTPVSDPALEVTLWDRKFPNPVGLAAGFDKNAAVIGPMFGFGFGFIEAGTVTPKPQRGNPRPRVFRDPGNESVINAMGFPNQGVTAFKRNIEKFLERRPRPPGVLGLNIGMNKYQTEPAKDYRLLIRQLGPLADYLVINISSPNTPGLRNLQEKENLAPFLAELMEERSASCGSNPSPLLVKLAPDLIEPQRADIAEVLLSSGVDGVILGNTTLTRPDSLPPAFSKRKGGLSGRPLRDKSTELIHSFYRLTDGKLPIIGLGGISDADSAWEKICAGATLVQLYTALVFRGPAVVNEINAGLLSRLRKHGFSHIRDAVGSAHRRTGTHG